MTHQVFTRDLRLDATKAAVALAMGGPDLLAARNWAVGRWGEAGTPTVIAKDASATRISGLDATSSTGLSDRELFRGVREKALLFRMRGIRRTGFKIRSITMSNSLASWVDEGKPIPVLKPTVSNVGLDPAKLCGLSVWTEEALKSSPGIEELIFDDLGRKLIKGLAWRASG